MTREELLLELTELLETNSPLTGSEELCCLGNWSSLTVIGFMSIADDRCGVTLAPKRINSCKTVNDLIELALGREQFAASGLAGYGIKGHFDSLGESGIGN
jgi:acyl carrier protein